MNLILCASSYFSVLAILEVSFIFVTVDTKEQESSRLLQMPFQHFGKGKDAATGVQGELNAILLSAGGEEVMHEEKI